MMAERNAVFLSEPIGRPNWLSIELPCGGHGLVPKPDQYSGSLDNWVKSAAFVIKSANDYTL